MLSGLYFQLTFHMILRQWRTEEDKRLTYNICDWIGIKGQLLGKIIGRQGELGPY